MIDSLTALLQRNSAAKLTTPAPTADELSLILQAAVRAPDHANLRPWRFIVVEETRLEALGNLLVAAKQAELADNNQEALTVELQAKLRAKPRRAPLIIIPVMHYQKHEKVPEVEQLLSVGCACQNILLAAEALSYSAMWRTGSLAFSDTVAEGLSLLPNEKALGFIYLGTRDSQYAVKKLPEHSLDKFVTTF